MESFLCLRVHPHFDQLDSFEFEEAFERSKDEGSEGVSRDQFSPLFYNIIFKK